MTNVLPTPPAVTPTPAVFDDPRGLRRVVVIAVGVLVCLGCLAVLAVAGGVLYADPRAPAARPAEAAGTNAAR
ncbi:hypothetical protein ACFW1A_26970 [Kitasatospora sp. NPDC058965]|uniref:hypothetical protein n=1 Tax=Kitasatospora sp. NPDC058965 TaxID=3346682 RepID=UPI00367E4F71